MSQLSQALTVIGIVFETIAIFLTAKRIFYTFEKWYDKELEEHMRSKKQRQEAKRKEQLPILITLVIGMILQIFGALV